MTEDFTSTCMGLLKWVQANGCRVSGAPFDIYVRGGDGSPPEDNVTEICFPITK